MSVSAIADARLSVLLDVRHPLAYLALQPAAAMGREQAVEVNWLPVVAPPLRHPTVPAPDDDRGVCHRRQRAHAIAREIAVYGAAQGLVLGRYYRAPDPAALNRAWLWIRDRHPQQLESFLSRAFRSYWEQALDPSSEAEVVALVDSLDVDGAGFRAWSAADGVAVAASLADELQEQGLSRAPTYVIDGEVFVGRQHLPMIRWVLDGRTGAGPI